MITHCEATASRLTGYMPDLPTPFHADGTIDWAGLKAICRRQLAAGAPALVVAETAGEASTLTLAEHRAVIDVVVAEVGGRLTVIAGVSSNSTAQAIELAHQAEAAGADALIAVVPYYNKPMQAGICAHFRAIAGAARLPIIVHDAPSRTVRGITDEAVAELAASPQFIGLKDGSGDIARPSRLRSLTRPGFRLFTGDDAAVLGFLAHGGDGCISQLANLAPAACHRIYAESRRGRPAAATTVLAHLAPLAALLAEDGGPAALKYALNIHDLMSPTVRLPLVELPEASRAAVGRAMEVLAQVAATDCPAQVLELAARRR